VGGQRSFQNRLKRLIVQVCHPINVDVRLSIFVGSLLQGDCG